MLKIQTFGTKSRLMNNQYLAFGRAFEVAVKDANPIVLDVADVFTAYCIALERYDNSIVRVASSALTHEMTAADAERDNLYVGLLEQLRIAERHFEEAHRAAGLRLKPVEQAFKGGQKRSYDDQTGFTTNLVQELKSDKYKADIETLELTAWVTRLETANKRCADLASGRLDERKNRLVTGKTADTRPLCDAAYDAVVERINALTVVKGEASYADLIHYINTLIDHYRVVLSSRLGAGKGGQTSGGGNVPSGGGSSTGGGEEEPDRPAEI